MRKKLDERILAEGEATGHAHRVDVDVYEEGETRYFDGETIVRHEEHKIIPLIKKEWASGRVQEFDHYREEARAVHD